MMKKMTIGGFCLGLHLFLGMQTYAGSPEPDWEKLSEEKGIEVFKKEIPGSPVIAFKGQAMVNAPIAKLITIMLDASRSTEWIDSLKESRTVRKISDRERIQYTHIGTPFVMKDRDFVTLSTIETDVPTKTFRLKFKSVTDPAAPETGYVRGEMMNSSFTFKAFAPDQTYVIAEIHADPKGSVAKWIVNLFQKMWPKNTLESLRKQAAKKDIPEEPTYKKLFYPN